MDIWIFNIFRTFISLIDKMVYWFIELLVSLFDSLASVRLFNAGNSATNYLEVFSNRIYVLIAIVMIFKVSFSIIQFIINPDKFGDNERGMGKMIQGILLVLVSLVGVRYVFNIVYDFQSRVVDNHIIEQLILGMDDNLIDENAQVEIKNKIPFTVLSAFVRPNISLVPIYGYSNGQYSCDGVLQFKDNQYNTDFGACIDRYTKAEQRTYNIRRNGQSISITGQTGTIYNRAYMSYDYSMLLDLVNDATKSGSGITGDVYLFDYKFIISTVAGIFVVIMYLNFCIDLAIRTVKFGFLQLIAPIPIISMVDPKSSKSGMMSKWVKTCMSTYLGLFIRIAAVNFVIFIIQIVTDSSFLSKSGTGSEMGTFLQLVIIFGALMFAKEVPKLIEDLTGIDLKGEFKLNPLTRIPVVGKAVQGVGFAAGTVVGAGVSAVGTGILGTAAAPLHSIPFFRNRYGSSGIQLRRTLGSMGNIMASGGRRALDHLNNSIPHPMGGGSRNSNASAKSENDVNYNESEIQLKRGEQLYNRYVTVDGNGNKQVSYTEMYKNSDFANAVKNMDVAKKNMFKAQNEAEDLERRAQRGDPNVDAQMIADAKKKAADGKSNYDLLKGRVDTLGQRYKLDYKRYTDYKAYKDYREALDSVDNSQLPNNGPTLNNGGTSNNASTSNNNSSSSNGSGSPTRVQVRRVSSNNAPTSNNNSGQNNNNP